MRHAIVWMIAAGCMLANCEPKSDKPAPTAASLDLGWMYNTDVDKMKGTSTFFASLYSSNAPEQQSPYNGDSTLELTFWKEKGGHAGSSDPQLVLKNGQFDCHGMGSNYKSCRIALKLDKGPVFYMTASEYDCAASQCLWLASQGDDMYYGKSIIPLLKNVKVLTVEVPLYHYGDFQYEFHTAGLKWSESHDRQ